MQDFPRIILFFLLSIGPLVVFHELGHFWVARLCGVKVLRFSFGLGRPLWTYKSKKTGTEWSISTIPLGGYVKMLDAREADITTLSESELSGEFTRQNVWKRIAIVAAGPCANFLLAILVFAAILMNGVKEPTSKIRISSELSPAYQSGLRYGDRILSIDGVPVKAYSEVRWKILQAAADGRDLQINLERPDPVIRGYSVESSTKLETKLSLKSLSRQDLESDFMAKLGIGYYLPPAKLRQVEQGGPAAKVDLRAGDIIVEVNAVKIRDFQDLQEIISTSPEKDLAVRFLRDSQSQTVMVRPQSVMVDGRQIGRIQVSPDGTPEIAEVDREFFDAFKLANSRTWEYSALTLKMLGKIVTGQASIKNITGPITIATYADQAAKQGFQVFLAFVATISISLGVMNLLPIPLLDGGHLLYYSLEVLTGKAIPMKYLEIAQRGGFAILACMMVIALVNDVLRKLS